MPKRRGRGEGSIEKLPSGNYRVVVSKVVNGERIKEGKTFDTKAEALDWRDERRKTGPTATGTLGIWLDDWLKIRKPKISPATFLDDTDRVRRLIRPTLGEVRLRDLTTLKIEKWLAGLAEKGMSTSERQKAGACLRKCLNAAIAAGVISASPFGGIRLPRPKRPEKMSLDTAQARAVIAAAVTRGCGPLFRFWLDSGVRPQELFALEWSDYDASERTVFVRRAFDQRNRTVKETKTLRSRRKIPLGGSTVAALDRLKAAATSTLMFPDTEGGYWWQSNFQRVVFRPVCKAAGIPVKFRPYDMRHTMASLLLQAGVSVKVVSERLGHDDIQTTLAHYAHVLPGMQEAAAVKMEEILGCEPATPAA